MRTFLVMFQLKSYAGSESLTSRTFRQAMTTKFPTSANIRDWEKSIGNYGYCHCLSYVELSEEE